MAKTPYEELFKEFADPERDKHVTLPFLDERLIEIMAKLEEIDEKVTEIIRFFRYCIFIALFGMIAYSIARHFNWIEPWWK